MRPRPCVAMKLMASAVTRSAAMVRSPSFSRSSSSTTITIRPARICSMAWATVRWGSDDTADTILDEAGDVLGDQVNLDVDTISGAALAEVGDGEGVRYQHDVDHPAPDSVDGQA